MSKVINKIVNKNKNRVQRSYPSMNRNGSSVGLLRSGSTKIGYDDNSDMIDDSNNMNKTISEESPRSVGGSTAEELFNQHRMKNSKLYVSYDAEGSLNSNSHQRGGSTRSSNDGYSNATGSRGSKDKNVNFINEFSEHGDITQEPNSIDYVDADFSNYCDYDENDQQQRRRNSNSKSTALSDYSFSNGSFDDPIQLQYSYKGKQNMNRYRSRSVQRTSENFPTPSDILPPLRAVSAGRSSRKHQENNIAKLDSFESPNSPPIHTSIEEPKRKSKMEKIFQLQEKNQRYKDEFRKVQKDRKALKSEIEQKRIENAALTKEIDKYIMETSLLQQKLTSALQKVDHSELHDRKDKSLILKLQKDLATVQSEYSISNGRVTRLREEVETMKILLIEKDDEIKSLSEDLSDQINNVDALHLEIIELKNNGGTAMDALKEENDRLHIELGETLERASSMVKEREDAIADLLKDNEDLRRMLTEAEGKISLQQDLVSESNDNDKSELTSALEEIAQLREELSVAAAALEEAQDRNVLLEEDVEAWILKKEEMEGEIQRLHDEIEAWQAKTTAAERSMSVVETTAQASAKKVVELENALKEAEVRYNEQLQEQERRHTEALLDQKEKITQQMSATNEMSAPQNPQELMLQKAVADRKAKEAAAKCGGIWNSVKQRVQTGGASNLDSDDKEISAEQKRIKELELINADQEDEINKTKSEMVKLRSTYNDTIYNNKKHIEQLMHEKEMYEAKQQAMEFEMKELRKEIENLQNEGSTVASF
jgi:hypothetical protein